MSHIIYLIDSQDYVSKKVFSFVSRNYKKRLQVEISTPAQEYIYAQRKNDHAMIGAIGIDFPLHAGSLLFDKVFRLEVKKLPDIKKIAYFSKFTVEDQSATLSILYFAGKRALEQGREYAVCILSNSVLRALNIRFGLEWTLLSSELETSSIDKRLESYFLSKENQPKLYIGDLSILVERLEGKLKT